MSVCGCLGNLAHLFWTYLCGSRLELGWTHSVGMGCHNCLILLGPETSWVLKSWWWQSCKSRIYFLTYWVCLGNLPKFFVLIGILLFSVLIIMLPINFDSWLLICILCVSFSCLFFPPYLTVCSFANSFFFWPLRVRVPQDTLCICTQPSPVSTPPIQVFFFIPGLRTLKWNPCFFTPSLFKSQFPQHRPCVRVFSLHIVFSSPWNCHHMPTI